MLRCAVHCQAVLCWALPRSVMPCYARLPLLCHDNSRASALPRYVMLCYVTLCHALLCHALGKGIASVKEVTDVSACTA